MSEQWPGWLITGAVAAALLVVIFMVISVILAADERRHDRDKWDDEEAP